MKKIFILLLTVLLICFTGCQHNSQLPSTEFNHSNNRPNNNMEDIQDVSALKKKAIMLAEKHDYARALDTINKAVSIEKSDDLYITRGYVNIKMGNNKNASDDLTEAMKIIKSDKNKALIYGMSAYIHDENGDDENAMKAVMNFEKIADKAPDDVKEGEIPVFYGQIGTVIANDKGEYSKAITYLNKAIEQEPNNVAWLFERGYTYYRAGDKEKALKDMSLWHKNNKSAVKDKYNSIAYMVLGEYDKSLEYINKAIKAEPDDYTLYSDRAFIYIEKGDTKSAEEDLNKVMKKYSGNNNREMQFARSLEKKIKKNNQEGTP